MFNLFTFQIFKANSNSIGVYASWFDDSLVTRFLRILPQTFEKAICLRTEVYGSTFGKNKITNRKLMRWLTMISTGLHCLHRGRVL